MSESPRELAAKIADHQADADADAVTVAGAYLELLGEAENYVLWSPRERGHYQAHKRFAAYVLSPAAEEPAA